MVSLLVCSTRLRRVNGQARPVDKIEREREGEQDAGELLLLAVAAERNPFGKRTDKTSSSEPKDKL